jgi:hypothetical protein
MGGRLDVEEAFLVPEDGSIEISLKRRQYAF